MRLLATSLALTLLGVSQTVLLSGCKATRVVDGAIHWSSSQGSLTLDSKGTVEFTDDDRDVKGISPGGYVLIQEATGGRARTYRIEADANGSLSQTYKVDGSSAAMDADAKAWAAGKILTLIRETAVNAGARINRLLRQGGPSAVLREVAEMQRDAAKRIYLQELIQRGHLKDYEL